MKMTCNIVSIVSITLSLEILLFFKYLVWGLWSPGTILKRETRRLIKVAIFK
jgi:hypothetical protein